MRNGFDAQWHSMSVANTRSERNGNTWSTVADILIDLGQGDSVTLRQALNADGAAAGKIERIEFDDGAVWSDAVGWGLGLNAPRGCANERWRMAV